MSERSFPVTDTLFVYLSAYCRYSFPFSIGRDMRDVVSAAELAKPSPAAPTKSTIHATLHRRRRTQNAAKGEGKKIRH
jgi:hypothetical protein